MAVIQEISSEKTFSPVQETGQQNAKANPLSQVVEQFLNTPSFNWPSRILDSRCTLLLADEYEQIRSMKNEPFSKILDARDLPKILAVLPRELLRQKFNDEFGALSNEELLQKFPLEDLHELHLSGLIGGERIENIKENLKFSDVFPGIDLSLLCEIFSIEGLKEKFELEFGAASDNELTAKFDSKNLKNLNHWRILSDERISTIETAQKDGARLNPAPFSELLEKHGIDQLTKYFTIEELTEKFNSECNGKTDREILSDIDLGFVFSNAGLAVIGDRFKKLIAQGEVKLEKYNIERTFNFSPNKYSVIEKTTQPYGYSYIKIEKQI